MTDLTTSLIIDLKNDDLLRGVRRSSKEMARFSGDVDQSMRKSDRSVSRFVRNSKRDLSSLSGTASNVFGNFKNELLAIGGAWAGLSVLQDSAGLDRQLVRMSHTAGVARKETAKMRNVYFDIQKETGIKVEASRMATDTLLQSGLNLQESLMSTRAIADVSAVTHAPSPVLAKGVSVAAEIYGFDLAKKGVATDVLDKMALAGDLGSAELENLSDIFSKVGSWAKQAGMKFEGSLAFIEQLSLVEKSPDRLGTLAESTLRIFTKDKYKQKITENLGIDFYNKDGGQRNPFDVITEIASFYRIQKTDKQRSNLIAHNFGETDENTQRGIGLLLSDFSIENMYKLRTKISTESDGLIAKRLPDSIDNAEDQVSRLKGAMRESLDSISMPINKTVSSAIQYALDPKDKGGMGLSGLEILLGGATMLGGGLLAKKGMQGKGGMGGGLISGLAVGQVLENSMGVPSVYVVNMPSSMGGIPGMDFDKKGGKKKFGRKPSLASPKTSKVSVKPQKFNVIDNLRTSANNLPKPSSMKPAVSDDIAQVLKSLGKKTAAKSPMAVAGPAGVIAAAAWTVSDVINTGIEMSDKHLDTGIRRSMSDGIMNMMAYFGSESAKTMQAIEKEYGKPKASLTIKIDQAGRAKVNNILSTDMDVEVSGGSMLAP